MKTRIVTSVINNITYDQRVEKTCDSLYKSGYDVLLMGTQLHGTPQLKRPYATYRFPLFFSKGMQMFAEFNIRLFFQLLRKARSQDILWANDLDSLLPNVLVAKIKGNRLIFDSHELYSELPSVQGRFSQKVWRFLERKLIQKPDTIITVSDSIAHWMVENYGIEKPLVLKNVPRKKEIPFQDSSTDYILYQGALNKGRGLLPLIESIQYWPENIHLKIAGDGPYRSIIERSIIENNQQSRVELLGKITPEELVEITQLAQAGISLEEDIGLSYRFSLPNKLFDYIQAKIPVVATFLPETQQIVQKYEIGEIIENHSPRAMGKTINTVLANGKLYYKNGLEKASNELIWENQEPQLLSLVESVNRSNKIS